MTPGNSAISPSHLPSLSRSISILSIVNPAPGPVRNVLLFSACDKRAVSVQGGKRSISWLGPLSSKVDQAVRFQLGLWCGAQPAIFVRAAMAGFTRPAWRLERGPGGAFPIVGGGAGVEVVRVELDLAGLAGGGARRGRAGGGEHAV